jgi:hypothetical protein
VERRGGVLSGDIPPFQTSTAVPNIDAVGGSAVVAVV